MFLKNMKWYNGLQFTVLCLALALTAVDWGLGLWMLLAFVVATIVKMVAERRVGNPGLDRLMRVALLAGVAYWLLIVASMLWSNDMDRALREVNCEAVLLIAPLCVLLSDMSYIRGNHLRTMFYGLLLSVSGLFVYNCITGTFEDKNHTYVAMYILPVVAFVYRELALHRASMPLWHRLALYVAGLMAVVFLIYIDSRTGILCLYCIEVLFGVHLALRRQWWHGALLAVLLLAFTYTAEKTLPNHNSRLSVATMTSMAADEALVEAVAAGDTVLATGPLYGKYYDARMAINMTALKTIADRPVFGYGAGDGPDALIERYGVEGYQSLKEQHLNAHNQYAETALAIGVVGLLVLVWWLVMPLYVAWRKKSGVWEVLVLTFIVMFSFLFESILERQMGAQFVGLLYAIMLMIISSSCRCAANR